jgi:hypothetical protein
MVDQLDSNTRTQEPDVEVDDPLAELARIIGYERPVEKTVPLAADNEPVPSAFDLEAELMRELDVLPADEADDQAEGVHQREADESLVPEEVGNDGVDAILPVFSAEDQADPFDDDSVLADAWLGNKPDAVVDHDDGAGIELQQDVADELDLETELLSDLDGADGVAETVDATDEAVFGVWEAPELDADWQRSEPDETYPHDTTVAAHTDVDAAGQAEAGTDELGQIISRDFGPAPAVSTSDVDDDAVLADMYRFELPAHSASSSDNQPVPADVSESMDSQVFEDDDLGPELAAAFDHDAELPVDDADAVDFADNQPIEDVTSATGAAEQDRGGLEAPTYYTSDTQADPATPSEPAIDADMDDGAVDFEDYLSAELDVFEHQVALSDVPDADEAPQPIAGDTPEPAIQAGEVATWDERAPDDNDFVFDEAAEELLADIADDAGVPEPIADSGWNESAIEASVSEELDEELEDMFGLATPVDESPAAFDESDDLEFDLDQILAETVVEAEIDPEQTFEPDALAPETVEPFVMDDAIAGDGGPFAEPEPDALQEAQPGVERDEIEEAFLGLASVDEHDAASSDSAAEYEMAGGVTPVEADYPTETPTNYAVGANNGESLQDDWAEPAQDDWLAGFETSDQTSQPAEPEGEGFFFDAEMISEPEDSVEAVADFGVPDLAHDEPAPVGPDFDDEIDREFADIIDEPEEGIAPASVVAGGIGAATGMAHDWSREAGAGRGYESSDDYIALERELGGDDVHVAPPYDEVDGDEHEPSPLDGEFATGMVGEPAPRNDSRGPFLALVVLGVAVLAGAGAFGWSMMSTGDGSVDGGPRIIRADKEPVKVVPENPGGVTVPNQDKAVYDRVAGGTAAQPGQPALINSAEEPVDVVQRTLDPDVLPLEGRGNFAEKSEERLTADGASDANTGPGAPAAPVVSPRKVRTMIVKPDGSIVAREDPTPEPVTQPVTTAAEQAEPIAAPLQVANQQSPATETAAPDGAAAPVGTAAAPADGETTLAEEPDAGTTAPVRVVTTQQIRAPVPQGRPADQPVNVVGTVTQGGEVAAAPAAPAATPAQTTEVASAPAAAAPVANPGGYYVQIASQPTVEGAQASWRTLSSRYSSVLGGRDVDIQRADIPGKGVFHRVRVVAGTRDQANALCSRYKAAGGSCFVSR